MFLRRAKKSGPMRFVHDGENTTTAANALVSCDLLDLETFARRCYVVEGDVERRGLGRKRVEHVLGEVSRKVLGQVVDVVGVPARVAANNGNAAFGVASRHVGGEVEVEELVMKMPAIRNGGGRCGAQSS